MHKNDNILIEQKKTGFFPSFLIIKEIFNSDVGPILLNI